MTNNNRLKPNKGHFLPQISQMQMLSQVIQRKLIFKVFYRWNRFPWAVCKLLDIAEQILSSSSSMRSSIDSNPMAGKGTNQPSAKRKATRNSRWPTIPFNTITDYWWSQIWLWSLFIFSRITEFKVTVLIDRWTTGMVIQNVAQTPSCQ